MLLAERTFFAVLHFHFMTAFQTQPQQGDGFFRFQTITGAQVRFLQRFSSLSFLLSVYGLAKFSYSCNAFLHFFFYFYYMVLHSLVSLLPDRSRMPPFFVSESDKIAYVTRRSNDFYSCNIFPRFAQATNSTRVRTRCLSPFAPSYTIHILRSIVHDS